jgi:hypothetical protein
MTAFVSVGYVEYFIDCCTVGRMSVCKSYIGYFLALYDFYIETLSCMLSIEVRNSIRASRGGLKVCDIVDMQVPFMRMRICL